MRDDVSIEDLKKRQLELAKKVVLKDKYSIDEIKHVIGVDQAFVGDFVVSCAIKFSYPDLEEEDRFYTVDEVSFPYIPSFLMFREGEPAVSVVKAVLSTRSVVIVDGSGIAHPRRCGLATYIAVETGEPSIGITKRKLFGSEIIEKVENEELVALKDGEETIGYVLQTCRKCKPIYISPGSYITPLTSLKIVRSCLRGYKLPEPVRAAHNFASEMKRKVGAQLKK
jgi:deoxyribonuclease V